MNFFQIQNMCSLKNKIKKAKARPILGKIFTKHIYDRSLYLEYTEKTYNSIIRQFYEPYEFFNGQKIWTDLLQKIDKQITVKYMRRYLTSLSIIETQIQTTMKYHYSLTRNTKTKKTDNSKCWQGYRATRTLVAWWFHMHSERGSLENRLAVSYTVKYTLTLCPSISHHRHLSKTNEQICQENSWTWVVIAAL